MAIMTSCFAVEQGYNKVHVELSSPAIRSDCLEGQSQVLRPAALPRKQTLEEHRSEELPQSVGGPTCGFNIAPAPMCPLQQSWVLQTQSESTQHTLVFQALSLVCLNQSYSNTEKSH